MKLSAILKLLEGRAFKTFGEPEKTVITGATWDPLKVMPGYAYFCLEHEEFQEAHMRGNSLNHLSEAVERGASLIVHRQGAAVDAPETLARIEVTDDLNEFMAFFARALHGDPLRNIKVAGVTGTKGKTTTCQLIDSIFRESGMKTGYIGTLGVFSPSGATPPGILSNPLSTDIFDHAVRMRIEGVEAMSMEATSQGMHFRRNAAIDFDVAVFTNIGLDHLDFHKTVESYKSEKMKLFSSLGQFGRPATAVVNIDDSIGAEFIKSLPELLVSEGRVKLLTYGITNKEADLTAYPENMTGAGSTFNLLHRGTMLGKVQIQLPGLFNIYNALAAFACGYALGISADVCLSGLKNAGAVKGRFEKVDNPKGINILVDYAHTPDSLQNSLRSAREITKGKLICVFGCGGDRDKTKRPLMGRFSAEMADLTWVTSDNPRTEDPLAIIEDIWAGIPEKLRGKAVRITDRASAIAAALSAAVSGDTVLIAGKGHEQYQIIKKKKIHFSDREEAEKFFAVAKTEPSFQPAKLEISIERLKKNFQLIIRDMPDGMEYMSVVKDNALGIGLLEMAGTALDFGASYIGVANLDEALAVREKFADAPILVLGERFSQELPACIEKNLTIQVQSLERMRELEEIARRQNSLAKVHLKIDTGMSRYGIRPEFVADFWRQSQTMGAVQIEGVMTHFAQSDEADKTFALEQLERFKHALSNIRAVGQLPKYVHACNTGGYLDLPQAHFNMVRLGILPTGVYPSKVCRRININGQELEPVMTAISHVAFVKKLYKGDRVGYGMRFTAPNDMLAAVIPVGYSYGYPRLRNIGRLLINGMSAPIIGGVSLDAIIVNIDGIPEVIPGTPVTLLGRNGGEEITAVELADLSQTVCYDIMSNLNSRFKTAYINA